MAFPLLGVFLAASVVPLAKKLLLGLGIGWVTYTGLTALLAQVQAQVTGNFGMLGGSALQILTLAGFPDLIGIVLGGVAARMSFMLLARLGKVQS